ncbi:GFA family protein, partial [Rhizobiaceae sp. 2RAB30]
RCSGSVRYLIEGKPPVMGTCHCSRCRKLGTSTIVFVRREQFTLTSGEENIETVVPQPPYKYVRSFCRRCGTSLGEPLSPEASFPINAQCLDDDPVIRNTFFEFVSDLPAWLNLAATEQEVVDHNQSLGAIQE